MIKRFLTILMLAGIVGAAPDTGITMREGGIVRADVCVLAMDFETGIADDLSGEGNDGAVEGATFVAASGLSSGAVRFDGVGDYVDVGSDASLDNLGQLTYSAWIYPETIDAAARYIVTKFPSDATGYKILWVQDNSGNNDQLLFSIHGSRPLSKASANNILQINQWQHILVTWDGNSYASGIHLYINGIEPDYAFSQNGINLDLDDSEGSLSIGNRITDSARPFNGAIDEVLIYNKSLTASEITELYKAGMIRHPNP